MQRLRSLLIALPLALSGCNGVQVDAEHDPFTDLSALTTFARFDPSEPAPDTAEQEIAAAVERVLTAKGLTAAPRGDASLLFRHRLHVETKLQVNDPYYSFKAVETYEEGTLVLDLLEASDDRVVWRGTGSTRLEDVEDPEERRDRIDRTVDAILAQFPPPAR